MMHPKARWTRGKRLPLAWTSKVGPFHLEVDTEIGRCELCEYDPDNTDPGPSLWIHYAPTPCDAADLMRLTEAELARRLEETAGSMDGRGLVAETKRAISSAGPRRDADDDEDYCGCGDCSECCPRDVWDAKIASAVDTIARLSKSPTDLVGTPTFEPRFKVGDLVLVLGADIGRVAGVSGPAAISPLYLVEIDSESATYRQVSLSPYTLPPITSYADLADVLDELPEGWRVECLIERTGWRSVYSRQTEGGQPVYRGVSGAEWTTITRPRAGWLDNNYAFQYTRSSVLPPEGAK